VVYLNKLVCRLDFHFFLFSALLFFSLILPHIFSDFEVIYYCPSLLFTFVRLDASLLLLSNLSLIFRFSSFSHALSFPVSFPLFCVSFISRIPSSFFLRTSFLLSFFIFSLAQLFAYRGWSLQHDLLVFIEFFFLLRLLSPPVVFSFFLSNPFLFVTEQPVISCRYSLSTPIFFFCPSSGKLHRVPSFFSFF